MARTPTTAQLAALFSQSTSEVFLTLLDLTHSSFPSGGYYFVNNTEAVTYIGQAYTPFPFLVVLPDDSEESGPRARLVVGNVDRTLVSSIRGLSGAELIKVTMTVVMLTNRNPATAMTLTNKIASYTNFELRNVTYDAQTVSGELTLTDFLSEPWPSDRFTPNFFPGIF